jgi:hypothetical protein
MSEWKKFELKIPGKDVLEPVRNVLETLLVYLDILKAILETIKMFLIDFLNPLRMLVEALVKLILQLIEALRQTGLYGYFDIPKPNIDPNFNMNAGGPPAFVNRFKASLFDTRDPNRPQPVNLFNQGGYIILMVDGSTIVRMIRLVRALYAFFGKEFIWPRYEAPSNAKVIAVGSKGDPILAVAKMFSPDVTAVALEWTNPTTKVNTTKGFSDSITSLTNEFVPPYFLVERSTVDPNQEIDISQFSDPWAAGIVTYNRTTGFEDHGKVQKRKERLRDLSNEPVVKFQHSIVIGPENLAFWVGQLGKYRWIDTMVERDITYYYRVRAFSGTLQTVNLGAEGTTLDWNKGLKNDGKGGYTFNWPGPDNDAPVMGKTAGVFAIKLPKLYGKFDVLENLTRLLKVAYGMDFHRQANTKYMYEPMNPEKILVRPTFDAKGYPTGDDTTNTDIGRGSLANQAGLLEGFDSVPLLSVFGSMGEKGPDPVTGVLPRLPWGVLSVQYQAKRVAMNIASSFLQVGSGAIDGFRTIMQSPLPKGPNNIGYVLKDKKTLEEIVYALTDYPDVVDYGLLQSQGYATIAAYSDADFRLNLLYAVNYIIAFGGNKADDWVRISILKDIIPWAGELLYRMRDYIYALLDAFSGVIQEIKDFIDLLLRKINALEKFIQFLISLLEYIMSLEVECFMLNSGTITTGLPGWIAAVDGAEGEKPPMAPGGYSAGVVLAYLAPDVSGIEKAFKLIF